MKDTIYRQDAIDELRKYIAVNKNPNHDARIWEEGMNCALTVIGSLPPAHSNFFTWLLDEIWYEDVWELNWQAFPELLCRKLEKLGYVKRKGDEYERLDKQTGGD